MPSRRMIDARIWKSPQVTSLTLRQRLLWMGLITTADDQGRGDAHPGLVRGKVFPLDDFSNGDVQDDIDAIAELDLIILYDAPNGMPLYQVVKWWEYQKPRWAWPSELPAPEGWQDRERYRQGNRVEKRNWDDDDSATAAEPADDEPTVEPPRDHDEPTVNNTHLGTTRSSDSISINTKEKDSAADAAVADAPIPTPEKPKRRKRAPSQTDKLKTALVDCFCEVSLLKHPALGTNKQRREFGELWSKPLLEIAEACDKDPERTKGLITWAVGELHGKEFTIGSPKSILKTALAEQARRKRNGTGFRGNTASNAYGKGHCAAGIGPLVSDLEAADSDAAPI